MANSTVWKCIIWFQIIHKNYNISHVFSQPSLSYFKNPLFIPFSVSLSLSLSLSIEFCTLNKTEGSWSYKIAPVFWNGKMEMNIRFGFNTFVFKLWVGQAWGLSELGSWIKTRFEEIKSLKWKSLTFDVINLGTGDERLLKLRVKHASVYPIHIYIYIKG